MLKFGILLSIRGTEASFPRNEAICICELTCCDIVKFFIGLGQIFTTLNWLDVSWLLYSFSEQIKYYYYLKPVNNSLQTLENISLPYW